MPRKTQDHHGLFAVLTYFICACSAIAQTKTACAQHLQATPTGGRVIVQLEMPQALSNAKTLAALEARRAAVSQAQQRVLSRMQGISFSENYRFKYIPFLILSADAAAIAAIKAIPGVAGVEHEKAYTFSLQETIPLIGGNPDGTFGDGAYTGAGQTVAVIDSGIQSDHPFLAGKVVAQACFSSDTYTFDPAPVHQTASLCPGVTGEAYDPPSGEPCAVMQECEHGTHVAGIIAGDAGPGLGLTGVAKDAHLISIKVASEGLTGLYCLSPPCLVALQGDYLRALEYVLDLATNGEYDIAAANVSIGCNDSHCIHSQYCDALNSTLLAITAAIDNLLDWDIATVIAAGNTFSSVAVSEPACISSAVTVSATTKDDNIAYYSNLSEATDLLAPGGDFYSGVSGGIYSSIMGSTYGYMAGTSMAAPHVSGAFAVMRQKYDLASYAAILDALIGTGVEIIDDRVPSGVIRPRIRLDYAIDALPPSQSNSDPIAFPDLETAASPTTSVVIPVLQNDVDPDNDPLELESVSSGTWGTAVDNGDGTVTFTPGQYICGPNARDQFTYVVGDGRGGTDQGFVTVDVSCAWLIPILDVLDEE